MSVKYFGSDALNKLIDLVKTALNTDTDTATGNPAVFSTISEQLSKQTTVSIEPIQSGSGTPSPSNVRPISGLDSVEVERCGRNAFNEQMVLGDINGTTGADIDSSSYLRSDYVLINPALTYYLRTPTTIRKWGYFYDKNKQYLGESTRLRGDTNETFTIPSGAYYMRFLLQVSEYGSSSYQNNVCMNVSDPSFNGQYVPFEANDIQTTALPTTIYGGTLDLTNGRLVVDRAYVELDGSNDENWTLTSNRYLFQTLPNPTYSSSSTYNIKNCNEYNPQTGGQIYTYKDTSGYSGICAMGGGIYVVDNATFTTADLTTFKTWLSTHPLQVVYELATPVTYNLTPSSLSLLNGLNVVSTNGDTVEVTFSQGSLATLEDLVDVAESIPDDFVLLQRETNKAWSSGNIYFTLADGNFADKTLRFVIYNADPTQTAMAGYCLTYDYYISADAWTGFTSKKYGYLVFNHGGAIDVLMINSNTREVNIQSSVISSNVDIDVYVK